MDTGTGAPGAGGAAAGAAVQTPTQVAPITPTVTPSPGVDVARAQAIAARIQTDRAAAAAASAAAAEAGKSEAQKIAERIASLEGTITEERSKRLAAERAMSLDRAGVLAEYQAIVPVNLDGKALDDWLAAHPAVLRPRAPAAPTWQPAPKTKLAEQIERGPNALINASYLDQLRAGRPT